METMGALKRAAEALEREAQRAFELWQPTEGFSVWVLLTIALVIASYY